MGVLCFLAFFFKQWGGVRKDMTGRTLHGKTYDEMPRSPRRMQRFQALA